MGMAAPIAVDELSIVRDRFGPSIEVVFDGPAHSCPVCQGLIEQLPLELDLTGLGPVACHDCGVVLAATVSG